MTNTIGFNIPDLHCACAVGQRLPVLGEAVSGATGGTGTDAAHRQGPEFEPHFYDSKPDRARWEAPQEPRTSEVGCLAMYSFHCIKITCGLLFQNSKSEDRNATQPNSASRQCYRLIA